MRRALATLLLVLWLPSAAASAPLPAGAYAGRLEEAAALLDEAERLAQQGDETAARRRIYAAADRLSGVDAVWADAGDVEADLTDLMDSLRGAAEDPEALSRARGLLAEHLHAAADLVEAEPVHAPGARASLDRALAQVAGQSLLDRAREWVLGLFTRPLQGKELGPVPPSVWWIGGAVGALALAWAGFALYRGLTGHGAGTEGTWREGRRTEPARPPTPAELLHAAQEAADRSDYLAAVRLSHLALLQHLDGLGIIRYQPAQTDREHERQLARRRPDLVPALRSLHDLLEGLLYGGRPARADEFRQAESLVMQLWREGDATSGSAATPGPSSSA
ncbi:DUF4129 domain-containing protein [Symbiobacterium thermophilum]|uniref:Protein-glutamine gamma-glutamyltransferase-like C-terminal domain-containing protein n=1 Tax=Symbiobacterium thermophilum (strain DSM 24528 / JCM 14929 / IAM 14863 / T) TaxID=292459 RepID=Q67S92_SYMTH|nr:DUF4129 domain-containing protein [Symbiobacterium thermophilum]BAD39451.1 hypothetical protein STH466 [Symbiobacterium thermophilum IAM 14863]